MSTLLAGIIEKYPALKALVYVLSVVMLPFELIEEACVWTVSLFTSLWDRIFHRNTADAA